MAMTPDSTGHGDDTPPENISKDHISDTLKRVYDDVAREPLPDKILDLLKTLKNNEPQ